MQLSRSTRAFSHSAFNGMRPRRTGIDPVTSRRTAECHGHWDTKGRAARFYGLAFLASPFRTSTFAQTTLIRPKKQHLCGCHSSRVWHTLLARQPSRGGRPGIEIRNYMWTELGCAATRRSRNVSFRGRKVCRPATDSREACAMAPLKAKHRVTASITSDGALSSKQRLGSVG